MFNEYEKGQLKAIETWVAEKPWIITQGLRVILTPLTWLINLVIPSAAVRAALDASDWLAKQITDSDDVLKACKVASKGELKDLPLSSLDDVANSVQNWAITAAGGIGGAGGAFGLPAMILEVPTVITLALRTIRKVGVCYGFGDDTPEERQFIFSVLAAVGANSQQEKIQAIATLKMIEVLIARNSWKKIYEIAGEKAAMQMAEKAAATTAEKAIAKTAVDAATKASSEVSIRKTMESIEKKLAHGIVNLKELAKKVGINLTKRKALQAIPVIGAVVGASVNAVYLKDIGWAARYMYQKRWLDEKARRLSQTAQSGDLKDVKSDFHDAS